MSKFVLVVQDMNQEQLDKADQIVHASHGLIQFIPEGWQSGGPDTVQSQNMRHVPTQDGESYHNMRYEWGDGGTTFAVDLLRIFVRESSASA